MVIQITNCALHQRERKIGGKIIRKCSWTIGEQKTFGYFHEIGLNVGFNSDGYGVNYAEAIAEDENGNVYFVPVDSIQFISDDYCNEDLEKIEKLNELSDLFEKTFDWGCNDEAKDLYANAVYAIISGNKIYEECIDKFKDHMLENLGRCNLVFRSKI